jgi:hypothetical protein
MNISQQQFFSNQAIIKVQPQTVKNQNQQISQHQLKEIKLTQGDEGMGTNRGQKEIIIRKNSSKKLLNRPTSQGGNPVLEENSRYKSKNKYQSNVI